MIAIVNVGPFDDPDHDGWRDYEIRINNTLLTRFEHKRSDGLGKCLSRAAEAAYKYEYGAMIEGSKE